MDLVTFDEAWARLERHVPAMETAPWSSWHAVEPRWLACDVAAAVDLPPFSRSMMDGYAIHADDLRTTSPLRVVADVRAGDAAMGLSVKPGEAVRVRTGAPVPAGTAAVVRNEWVEAVGDTVRLLRAVPAGESVQPQGDDARRGDVIARAGQLVDGQTQAVLRSASVHESVCHRPLIAAILSTGSELVTGPRAKGALPPGQVYAATDAFLRSALAQLGVSVAAVEHAEDDRGAIVEAAERLASAADLLLVTGGASVGDADYARDALEHLEGAPLLFERVWMRPGAPLLARPTARGFAFALSGNPAAAYVQFHALVVPFVLRWLGASQARPFPITALIEGDVRVKPVKHTRVLRGRLHQRGATLFFRPEDKQSSGSLTGLVSTNAIARMDGDHLADGEPVAVAWTRGWLPSLGLMELPHTGVARGLQDG
ncbi:molybdopterin molybdotransferase MoeA [Alicyclobacillus fructus]|uniref:molybdopterin molybdotransferase MoeA n=1 Tax=Alicyclobacillus fructus TaxID=2816082 RepID=UPI001A8C33DF|nr:molybdopterin molybdotransferase MoeA [Alicyclobacillus fructus]